jgi:hypothetical protein
MPAVGSRPTSAAAWLCAPAASRLFQQPGHTILKAARLRMDLLGLAAPPKSMSLQASVELDSENEALQAQLAEAYQSALEEKDRELAEMRARLGRV